ncbi:hypothetical protein KQI63_12685 [bacterium]|nr:hypothetical protein [bacterium]
MKLRPLALGLTFGLLLGLAILSITWWVTFIGSPGTTLGVLRYVYLGYQVSWIGGLIGFLWGFVDGFVGGYLFALIYNLFVKSDAKPPVSFDDLPSEEISEEI